MQWPSLSVRVAYSQAALSYSLVENEDAAVAMSEACQEAFALGMAAFNKDEGATLPALFADVADLRKAWEDGCWFAEETEIMRNCDGCQNPEGNPCPVHG